MSDGFNLDAILGESADRPLTYKGTTLLLPGELPAGCLAPFLRDDLGLIDLLAEVLGDDEGDEDDDKGLGDMLFDVLKKRPNLPSGLVAAARDAFQALLGDEQYAEFIALRPSVPAYLAIGRAVVTEYGLSLADFFGLGESSETDGTDSKPTSPGTTDSTPEASGDDQEPKGS